MDLLSYNGLFCQSILAKTAKNPWFLKNLEIKGYFCAHFAQRHPFATIYTCFRRPRRPLGGRAIIVHGTPN
jgi:hypothetical protein